MIIYWLRKSKILVFRYTKRILLGLHDLGNILFSSSSDNFLRVETCKKDDDGFLRCTFSGKFKSYRALKDFQKRFRAVTFGSGTVVSAIVFAFLSGWLSSTIQPQSLAATFGWVQTDWSGEDSIEVAIHSTEAPLAEAVKWDKYTSQNNLDATSTPGEVSLRNNLTPWGFDTDGEFVTWNMDTEVQGGASALSLYKKDGDVCANTTVCDSAACTENWSIDNQNICHADSAKCAYYNGSTVSEYVQNYILCSGNDWYKTCGVGGEWGAAVNNDNPTASMCNFEGNGTNTGIYPANTCTNGTSGGFSSSCTSCNYFLADSASACKTTCSTGADCWASADCFGTTCYPDCSDPTFACGEICGYDGQGYDTVQIGSQCWFRENLNVGTRINIASNQSYGNGIVEKWCYNDLESGCDTYGGYYIWNEALQAASGEGVQGICPSGWHIPTDAEATTLSSAVIPGTCSGTFTGYYSCSPAGYNLKSNSQTTFSFLLSGSKWLSSISSVGIRGYFWTSSGTASLPYYRKLENIESGIYRNSGSGSAGYSVRCIRN
ncbi:hypothetical protein C0584_02550 [Candidatus Parcubacteria bacterium]|nr:MAG: hypothetical protein C0584_02550 [Candidatus Parcubacteria bacterium]